MLFDLTTHEEYKRLHTIFKIACSLWVTSTFAPRQKVPNFKNLVACTMALLVLISAALQLFLNSLSHPKITRVAEQQQSG